MKSDVKMFSGSSDNEEKQNFFRNSWLSLYSIVRKCNWQAPNDRMAVTYLLLAFLVEYRYPDKADFFKQLFFIASRPESEFPEPPNYKQYKKP